ncbi:uncharacterized protein LOC135385257 [Ornithodoros turicata]|uniref:uncharacterized protein LOC135385257 n=1 Tax=Ornithodoros turicata TaxID=34597 RepID=UPI003139A8BF
MTVPGDVFVPGGFASLVNGWCSNLGTVALPNHERIMQYLTASGAPSARQVQKGHRFKDEGYVRYIYVHPVSQHSEYNVIKCVCLPSMRAGYYVVHAVVRKDNGNIEGAHCYCPAGLSGSCQHVAGLLFSLEETAPTIEPSCTDVTCTWVVPPAAKKPDPPTPIDKIKFKRDSVRVSAARSSYSPAGHLLPGDHCSLVAALEKVHPECIWLRYNRDIEEDETDVQVQPAPLLPTSEDFMHGDWIAVIERYFEGIQPLSSEERESICQATVGQASNHTWHRERQGRLTSSVFGRVMKCKKPEGLVKDILYPKKQVQCEALRYGRNREPDAVNAYLSLMSYYDRQIVAYESGLHIHPVYAFLAASPDRIVKEGADVGILEVKCPFSQQGRTPLEACTTKGSCCEEENGALRLKRGHQYYAQVQGQMAITGYKWCDFVVWTNNGSLQNSVSVERIYFDKVYWDNLLLALLHFYKHAVIPEVLTGRLRATGKLFDDKAPYVPYLAKTKQVRHKK